MTSKKKTTKKVIKKPSNLPERVEATREKKQGIPLQKFEKDFFIDSLALVGRPTEAAKLTNRDLTTFYLHRKKDKDFSDKWDEAIQHWIMGPLEEKVIDFAFNGWFEQETKIQEIKIDGETSKTEVIHKRGIKKYSPTLMFKMLERRHPYYRPSEERSLTFENPNKNNEDDSLAIFDLDALEPNEVLELERLMNKAAHADRTAKAAS